MLNSYKLVTKIPVAHCCTVWTDSRDSTEYLLVGDQMLWFRTLLENSLINPNQMRAYGLLVNDNPFNTSHGFGVNSEQVFIPFDTMGTVVYFNSCIPTEWEKTHLLIFLVIGKTWNPIRKLTSGMAK
jgi:hypothetical protein